MTLNLKNFLTLPKSFVNSNKSELFTTGKQDIYFYNTSKLMHIFMTRTFADGLDFVGAN